MNDVMTIQDLADETGIAVVKIKKACNLLIEKKYKFEFAENNLVFGEKGKRDILSSIPVKYSKTRESEDRKQKEKMFDKMSDEEVLYLSRSLKDPEIFGIKQAIEMTEMYLNNGEWWHSSTIKEMASLYRVAWSSLFDKLGLASSKGACWLCLPNKYTPVEAPDEIKRS